MEIDRLGGWDCASSIILPMEEVPGPYRKAWSTAFSTVIRRILQARTEEELTRGLKWLLAVAKLLLREPRRGGKGKGTGEVASRFTAVREGNWGHLIQLLQRDEEAERRRRLARRRRGRREVVDPTEEKAKKRKTVLAKTSRGQVGQARRLAISSGVASMQDPVVRDTMQAKYPPRSRDMPATVHRGTAMDSLPCLRDVLLGLEPGKSGGFGGMRNEYLRCAAQNWDERELGQFEEFGLLYLNVHLLPWFYRVANSVSTVALFKTAAQDKTLLRPVGVKSSWVRSLHGQVIKSNRGALREHCEPEQLCFTPGCGAKIVHIVRMMTEAHPDWPCVPIDFRNAHNEVSRCAMVEACEAAPALQHLALHMAAYLASHHRLEASGEEWGEAEEGHTQGDPEASAGFAVALQPAVEELHRALSAVGGLAVFGNDDGYAIGPPELLFRELDLFRTRAQQICNLSIQVAKTKVYLENGEKPAEAPANMPQAGVLVGGQLLPGFQCYGVAIGSADYVQHMLGEKVAEVRQDVDKVLELLNADHHAAWVLLSTSLSQQLDYLLTLQYPRDIYWPAGDMDAKLWEMVEHLAGHIRIPQGEEGMGVECVLQLPGVVEAMQGRSYQRLIAAQPVKLGGLGRRELQETSPAAFIGGVEQAIPYMLGLDGKPGLCPQLADLVGRVEGPQRWAHFLGARSRTAQEFEESWTSISGEAASIHQYLGTELTGVLAEPVAGDGGESCSGSIRRLIVEQRESLRHQLLTTALRRHRDRQARPVTVHQNVANDKVAGRWLLNCPSPDLGFSTPVFQEALSSHLCMPSPAIRDGAWLGKRMCRECGVIDRWGDAVMCCKHICGDTYRRRHDTVRVPVDIAGIICQLKFKLLGVFTRKTIIRPGLQRPLCVSDLAL